MARCTALAPLAFLMTIGLATSPARAGGWQEMHETSDDVRFEVGSDGVANVVHHLRYRVVAGHFKSFELPGLEPHAELATDAVLVAEKGGAETPARIEAVAKSPGTIKIVIDEGKGLTRGAYTVDVRYRLDLVSTKILVRDGAMWRLAWTAPPAPEGHDGARVVFDLPTAPTEPRLAAAAESTTTLTTLKRSTERDELELVRPHIPRGEAAIWAVRVDPKGFARVSAPDLRPPPPAEATAPTIVGTNLARIAAFVAFVAIAGALAELARRKARAVEAAAALRDAEARPLVPLPWGLGPFAYGLTTTGALGVLLWSSPIVGAALVALAMALGAYRAPRSRSRPRAPGSWKPMTDPAALLPEAPSVLPTDAFDASTRSGALALGALVMLVAGASALLRAHVPQIALALPLASTALVPLFASGTRGQLSPMPTELAARLLRPTRDVLASTIDLTHVEVGAIGRVVGERVDEVRLSCAPRDRTPGLRVIELALAPYAGGHGAVPEVFVRYDEGSPAAARIARALPGVPVVRGRTPDEKVMRLAPEEPTAPASAALVAKLLAAFEGRRASDRHGGIGPRTTAWRGVERRSPAMC